jgi:hypothetical protein
VNGSPFKFDIDRFSIQELLQYFHYAASTELSLEDVERDCCHSSRRCADIRDVSAVPCLDRETPDPLAKFTVMNLPRSYLDVGALWTQGIGPTRGSGNIPRVVTRSLHESEISTVANLDASILAKLARSLDLIASGSTQLAKTVTLKGLTIVTVADASDLASVAVRKSREERWTLKPLKNPMASGW